MCIHTWNDLDQYECNYCNASPSFLPHPCSSVPHHWKGFYSFISFIPCIVDNQFKTLRQKNIRTVLFPRMLYYNITLKLECSKCCYNVRYLRKVLCVFSWAEYWVEFLKLYFLQKLSFIGKTKYFVLPINDNKMYLFRIKEHFKVFLRNM